MNLSVFYLILMYVWFIGAEIWIFTAMRRDEPKLLWIAGLYGLVMILNGVTALAYYAQGQ